MGHNYICIPLYCIAFKWITSPVITQGNPELIIIGAIFLEWPCRVDDWITFYVLPYVKPILLHSTYHKNLSTWDSTHLVKSCRNVFIFLDQLSFSHKLIAFWWQSLHWCLSSSYPEWFHSWFNFDPQKFQHCKKKVVSVPSHFHIFYCPSINLYDDDCLFTTLIMMLMRSIIR